MYKRFNEDIAQMNTVYQLATILDEGMLLRLQQFKTILFKECEEIDELITEATTVGNNITSADSLRIRTGVADLLADIVVYCASEAKRWNIPIDQVLQLVMSSNFSKLGANGLPIKDENDKFLKGPNYWKPEPLIAKLLAGELTIAENILVDPAIAGAESTVIIQATTSQTAPADS